MRKNGVTDMQQKSQTTFQYIGGPTAVLSYGGLRFVIDPAFDPPGDHPVGNRVLRKLEGPALPLDKLGAIDIILLSHDQHPDNLDNLGKRLVAESPLTFSTIDAEHRLGGNVRGLLPWQEVTVAAPNKTHITITAVPALHGPEGSEPLVGKVTGFVLAAPSLPTIYISGDNASLDNVRHIANKMKIDAAVLFAGAAQTALANGANLTLTSAQTVQAAKILNAGIVLPLHFEHWAHFTEGREDLRAAFKEANMSGILHLLDPGEELAL